MILIVYGTRPEYIKLKSVIKTFQERNIPFKTLFTFQHETLDIPRGDLNCYPCDPNIANHNRLNYIIRTIGGYLYEYHKAYNFKYVMVQGDTTTALGGALAAFNLEIPIMHVEAGLRSGDLENPYPEEGNRKLIDSISKYCFCPRSCDSSNLLRENSGDFKKYTFVTGNTINDILPNYICSNKNKILITLHRRENHDILSDWIESINDLASKYSWYEFVFISHPNPKVQEKIHKFNKYITISKPLDHDILLKFIAEDVAAIITDSGGLQEEACFYQKPVFVCRKTTERSFAGMSLVGDPSNLNRIFTLFAENHFKNMPKSNKYEFGDGKASERIADIVQTLI